MRCFEYNAVVVLAAGHTVDAFRLQAMEASSGRRAVARIGRFVRGAALMRRGSPVAVLAVMAAVAGAVWFTFVPRQAAFGQSAPALTLSPSSGPCDATITVNLSGFEPNETVTLDIATPFSGGIDARLKPALTDTNGSFKGERSLGEGGCSAAAKDAKSLDASKSIMIYAGADLESMSVMARAGYAYTTTTASPKTEMAPETTDGAMPTPSPTPDAAGSGGTLSVRWLITLAVAGGLAAVLLFVVLIVRRPRQFNRRR